MKKERERETRRREGETKGGGERYERSADMEVSELEKRGRGETRFEN